jgi:hypothetical protein
MLKKISIALTTALFAALALAPGATAATPTTLTTLQKVQIKFLVEEEKMARDVYTYLAAKITTRKFTNISRSEQTHMNYLSALITKYNLSNPTIGKAPGVFVNTDIQGLYNALTAEGGVGLIEAYGVGVKVEEHDIATIKKILANPMPDDVKIALELLLAASYNHLEAFSY